MEHYNIAVAHSRPKAQIHSRSRSKATRKWTYKGADASSASRTRLIREFGATLCMNPLTPTQEGNVENPELPCGYTEPLNVITPKIRKGEVRNALFVPNLVEADSDDDCLLGPPKLRQSPPTRSFVLPMRKRRMDSAVFRDSTHARAFSPERLCLSPSRLQTLCNDDVVFETPSVAETLSFTPPVCRRYDENTENAFASTRVPKRILFPLL